MKKTLSLTLILSLVLPSILTLCSSKALGLNNESSEILLAREKKGNRGRDRGKSKNINHNRLGSNGSGRVQRPTSDRKRDNRVENKSTRDRNDRVERRNNINIDSRNKNTNRINRNIVNNGNIIINPRPERNSWGWHGGNPWSPNYNYWGGGFWGGFAVGAVTTAVTGAIINSNSSSNTTYVVIEKDTPGYYLFDSYQLTQVECNTSQNLVFIYGPQDTLMCANPNSVVSGGYYDVDPEDLVLVLRD